MSCKSKKGGKIDCCAEPETVECCSSKAAAALVGLAGKNCSSSSSTSNGCCTAAVKSEDCSESHHSASASESHHIKEEATPVPAAAAKPLAVIKNEKESDCANKTAKDSTAKATTTTTAASAAKSTCPRRRKSSVAIDFSTPCDCCPNRPSKVQKQRTFVEDLAALAAFLKRERKVLKTTDPNKIEAFYAASGDDTELVAEWKSSGGHVFANMLEKINRLEDMEAKFGTWEEHFS